MAEALYDALDPSLWGWLGRNRAENAQMGREQRRAIAEYIARAARLPATREVLRRRDKQQRPLEFVPPYSKRGGPTPLEASQGARYIVEGLGVQYRGRVVADDLRLWLSRELMPISEDEKALLTRWLEGRPGWTTLSEMWGQKADGSVIAIQKGAPPRPSKTLVFLLEHMSASVVEMNTWLSLARTLDESPELCEHATRWADAFFERRYSEEWLRAEDERLRAERQAAQKANAAGAGQPQPEGYSWAMAELKGGHVAAPAVEQTTLGEWACCDDCQKWRRLPFGVKPPGDDERWTCSMNADRRFNRCEIDEEEMDANEVW